MTAKKKKKYPPNWEEGQSLPWNTTEYTVETGNSDVTAATFQLAFMIAVDAAYGSPGSLIRIVHDSEVTITLCCQSDGGLRVC